MNSRMNSLLQEARQTLAEDALDRGAKELLKSIAQKADENGITWVSDLDGKLVRQHLSDLQGAKLISKSGSKKNAVVKLTTAGKRQA